MKLIPPRYDPDAPLLDRIIDARDNSVGFASPIWDILNSAAEGLRLNRCDCPSCPSARDLRKGA